MSDFPAPMLRDEIQPFIVYRVAGGSAECATWQIAGGAKALALFLSEASATAYGAKLGDGWRVARPPRAGLLELLRTGSASGISFAALDPDNDQAKRVFDLREILAAVDGLKT
ncbi:MAG: hypothetical protein ACJ8F7_18300 [Gemmataceae bacterium]